MALGRKSPHVYIKVWNGVKFVFILIQASRKTLGICDIVETVRVQSVVTDPKTKKRKVTYENQPVRRLSDTLSRFQGQQYNNPVVLERIEAYLSAYLSFLAES